MQTQLIFTQEITEPNIKVDSQLDLTNTVKNDNTVQKLLSGDEKKANSNDDVTNENVTVKDLSCSATFILKEKGTRKPLVKSNMYLLPEGRKEVSDEKGQVFFEAIVCGSRSWVVNISGYKRLDINKNISQGKKTTTTLYIEPVQDKVYRMVVTTDANKRDGSKRTIDQDKFIKAIGSRGDPIVALENEPGFSGFSDQGGIILQGADPEDTRFYVNGHEIPLIFHSLGFSSVFVPESIQSVDLLTAGFGSEYGRTVGGNINLTTRDPKLDRLHGMAYVDLLNAGALVQGPLDKDKKHSFWLGGRVSYIGPVFNLVTGDDDNVQFNTVPQFFDLQANYQWKINEQWTFDVLGFGAQDVLRLRIKDNEDPSLRGDISFKTAFYRFIPRIRYSYGEKNSVSLSTAHGLDFINQELDDFFFDATNYAPTIRGEWQHHWHDQFNTVLGLDTKFTHFKADLSVPSGTFQNSESDAVPEALRDVITKTIDEKFWDLGAYTRFNLSTENQTWLFSPNVRFDYSELTDEFHISPRLEIRKKLNPIWTLRAASGFYYQTPQAPEVEASFGNPDLKDVKSIHYALGVLFDTRIDKTTGLFGDMTLFYRDISNVVVDTDELIDRNGVLEPLRYTNGGDGYAAGAQWALNYKHKKFESALSYTLLWSERKEEGEEFRPTNGDQRHNFNMRTRVYLNNWELSARLRYVSGARHTPIVDAYYDLDNDIYIPIEGIENSERVPDTFQLDLRADRKWRFDQWIMSLYIDILNVTNRKNGFDYDYSFDYSSREVAAGIPVLPTFGIKGEF
ncbi:TonB-dependent receptor plug domain-containing protein [bacterium]|nr:TonB-dependent receptor plug domain-containing protein [bacterium]